MGIRYIKKFIFISFLIPFLFLILEKDACSASQDQGGNGALSEAGQTKSLQESKRHIEEGRRFYKAKKYNLAIHEWELALSMDPENKDLPQYIQDAKDKLEGVTKEAIQLLKGARPAEEKMKKKEEVKEAKEEKPAPKLAPAPKETKKEGALQKREEKELPKEKKGPFITTRKAVTKPQPSKPKEEARKEEARKEEAPPPTEQKIFSQEIEKHIQEGRRYYTAGNYHLAIYEWELAMSLEPNNASLQERIREAKEKLKKGVPPAAAQLRKTPAPQTEQKKLQQAIDKHVKEGRRYYNAEKYYLAIYEWELALSLDPKNERILGYIQDAKNALERLLRTEVRPASFDLVRKEEKKVLSLNDCVGIAVKNHIPLQIAERNVKLSESRLWEARRNLLPKINLATEESEGKIQGRRYFGKKSFVEGQHTLYKGGELYFTMKQAEVNVEVAKHDAAKTKNELILQVKKNYYSLTKAKENLKLQEELQKEVEKVFTMVNKQFESGVATKLELLNVSSQETQVKFQLASAKGDVDVSELILKQTMNVDPNEKIGIEPRLEFKKIDINFEQLLTMAFMNRPEMKMNSLTLRYYDYERRIAKAKDWPKVDLMGSWGLAKEEYVSIDNQPRPDGLGGFTTDPDRKLEAQWYAGAKVSMPFWGSTGEYSYTREKWPPVVSAYHGTEATTNTLKLNILDKLGNASDRIAAGMDYDRARQELLKTKQDITLELREDRFTYEKTLMQLETATTKVKYQEKDLEFVTFKRALDELQDSAVIESMIKLAQERFGYIQALIDYYVVIASLNKAIGINDYFRIEEEAEKKRIR